MSTSKTEYQSDAEYQKYVQEMLADSSVAEDCLQAALEVVPIMLERSEALSAASAIMIVGFAMLYQREQHQRVWSEIANDLRDSIDCLTARFESDSDIER
jgi:hypothetical protein